MNRKDGFTLIKSKYAGHCKKCNEIYINGEWVLWKKDEGCYHENCLHITPENIIENMKEHFSKCVDISFIKEENERYIFRLNLETMILIKSTNKAGNDPKALERAPKHYCSMLPILE